MPRSRSACSGPGRDGAGLAALHGARTGGDARTREAVRARSTDRARGPDGPQDGRVDGFEERFLSAADLEKGKAEIAQVGVS